jgi:hypothetical protein
MTDMTDRERATKEAMKPELIKVWAVFGPDGKIEDGSAAEGDQKRAIQCFMIMEQLEYTTEGEAMSLWKLQLYEARGYTCERITMTEDDDNE